MEKCKKHDRGRRVRYRYLRSLISRQGLRVVVVVVAASSRVSQNIMGFLKCIPRDESCGLLTRPCVFHRPPIRTPRKRR